MNRARVLKAGFGMIFLLAALSACQEQPGVPPAYTATVPPMTATAPVKPTGTATTAPEPVVTQVENNVFPPAADLAVRQAAALCTDKVALIQAEYPLLDETEARMLVRSSMYPFTSSYYAGDEFITRYPYDPEKGASLLENAGWKQIANQPIRQRADGTPLSMSLLATEMHNAWVPVWIDQMRECGIEVRQKTVSARDLYEGPSPLLSRPYDMAVVGWSGQSDPGQAVLWSCGQGSGSEKAGAWANNMNWCNDQASKANFLYENSINEGDRIRAASILQQEFSKDVPAVPLFTRPEVVSLSAGFQGFEPAGNDADELRNLPEDDDDIYNLLGWWLPNKNFLIAAITREPEELSTAWNTGFSRQPAPAETDDGLETILISSLLGFARPDALLRPGVEPDYLGDIPTIDSGLVRQASVRLDEGDRFVDMEGSVRTLKMGDMVRNVEGAEETFNGSPISVRQISVKYVFRDDMNWQNGDPVIQEDFELAYRAVCGTRKPLADLPVCEMIDYVQFSGTTYTVTYLPGYQKADYSSPPFGLLPAKRTILTKGPYAGKKMDEVPVEDLSLLEEITDRPWSFGPYTLTEWVKGQSLTFAANPAYFGTPPRTKTIIFKVMSQEDAEAGLIAGDVGILLGGSHITVSDRLTSAASENLIRNVLIPGFSWEQVQFSLLGQ